MIPSKFDYVVARSLDQALQLLGKHGTDAKILSGGHSLIPLMKFRLATPSVVVDVGRLSDLRFIREEEEDIVVGGLATHHMLESSALLLEKAPVLSMAAAQVGDVQVRNRGTIGGSLVHADPAADLPAAVVNYSHNFFFFKKFVVLALHAATALNFADALFVSLARYLVLANLGQGLLCITFRQRLHRRLDLRIFTK